MNTEIKTETNLPSTEDPFNVEYWKNRWVEKRIGWHKTVVNPHLLKHIGNITGQSLTNEPVSDPIQFQENSKKTWLVPLCGKSVDIPYLLSQGFRVFGVEAARQAVEELDQEHSLSLVFNAETSLSTGADGLLQIYIGDLFSCPIEKFGPFDYVWDRGSFIAVEYPFRTSYSKMMQRALKQSDGSWYPFKYILETVIYDKSKFGGPPRSVEDSDLEEHYGSWAKYELLDTDALPEDNHVSKAVDGQVLARVFFVTPK